MPRSGALDPAQRAAEQAVVKAAIQRGWLTVAVVGEARRAADATGTSLMAQLGQRLTPEQRQGLADVFRQALAAAGPISPSQPTPGAGNAWAPQPTPGAGNAWAPQPPPAGGDAWTRAGSTAASAAPPAPEAVDARAEAATAGWGGSPGAAAGAMPARIGPYDVERELARGGMGAVYIAHHAELGRKVALKVMLPDDEEGGTGEARFEREARVLGQLRHPNIVVLHESGQEGARRWMALELVSGGSLQGRLDREGPLDPRVAVSLMVPVTRAISAAHAQGLLHRDLKPANILIDDEGRPKVTDFGIARSVGGQSQQLTRTGVSIGTASFAPPEQCGGVGTVDARADVYALGATLYTLLTGEPPFTGASYLAIVAKVMRTDAEPPSRRRGGLPPELDLLVMRCLEKDPEERYDDADALADELERWLRGEPLDVQPPTLGRRARRWRRRHPWLVAALLTLPALAVLAAVAAWALRARAASAPRPVEVTWVTPADGLETRAASLTIRGLVQGPADWVEVSIEGAGSPRRVRGGDFELLVPLHPGDNELVLRWRASNGETGGLPPRRVVQTRTPKWFEDLPAEARPPLPLPDGVELSPTPRVYLAAKDGSELVWVPPGTFTMCSPGQGNENLIDPARSGHEHPRPTTLTRGYFLGRYEVTWGQLDAFCEATGRPLASREIAYEIREPTGDSASQGVSMDNVSIPLSPPFTAGDTHPVYSIDWDAAAAYCAWAGLRLPTEAEWEWASRGKDARAMAWGNEAARKGECSCLIGGDGYLHTAPVGTFEHDRTPSGCFDMTGNVMEWVADAFGDIGPEPVVDPTGPAGAAGPQTYRVVRGASWSISPGNVRLTRRVDRLANRPDPTVGFRVAR